MEQKIVHLEKFDDVDKTVESWNKGGWRAIAISSFVVPGNWHNSSHYFIIFEKN